MHILWDIYSYRVITRFLYVVSQHQCRDVRKYVWEHVKCWLIWRDFVLLLKVWIWSFKFYILFLHAFFYYSWDRDFFKEIGIGLFFRFLQAFTCLIVEKIKSSFTTFEVGNMSLSVVPKDGKGKTEKAVSFHDGVVNNHSCLCLHSSFKRFSVTISFHSVLCGISLWSHFVR